MRALWLHIRLLAGMPLLGGCVATDAHSPTLDVFGSYFPAWMVCSVIGLVITVIVRLLLVGLGIHPHLRPKALVYVCFAILFTMGVWLVFFKK
jgi:hypothetical protein